MVEVPAANADLTAKTESEASFYSPGVGDRLPARIAVAFGAGSLGTAAFALTPQLLLLFFLTEQLAIPAAYAGIALLLPKLWEFVTNPLVGIWSDRVATRTGSRRPFLVAGALLSPIAFAAIFAVPGFAAWEARLAFVSLAFVLSTTACSLFAVSYVALAGEFTPSPHGRTRLVAWRMGFASIGILIAGGAAPAMVDALGSGRAAYAWTGLAIALLSAAAMAAAGWSAREARFVQMPVEVSALLPQLKAVASNRDFRSLGACYLVQMASSGLNAAMLAYAARYLLGIGEAVVGLFFLVFTVATLMATPLFASAGRFLTRQRGFVLASLIYAAGMALLALLAADRQWLLWPCAVVIGIGNAGTQLFAYALLPDVVDAARASGSVAGAGVFTGIWVAGEKLGLAAGGALGGLLLAATGFVEGAGPGTPQPRSALTAILLSISLVPAALMLASLPLLCRLSTPPTSRGSLHA